MKRFRTRIPLCTLILLPALAGALLFAACSSGPRAADSSAPAAQTAAGIEVIRIWPDYRTAESFERISEYFSDKENTGGQIILRTQPGNRAGYYFFTRLKTDRDIDGARVELAVITPASAEAKTYTLPAPRLPKGSVLLNPGLTGEDWPWTDATARPTAWRIRLLAADGSVLLSQQSFLWAK